MDFYIASVDPGRDKCGLAVLSADASILYRQVVETDELLSELQKLQKSFRFDTVVIGNGTTSQHMQENICRIMPNTKIVIVDEYNTTQLAKREYWKLTPPTGWRRLMPQSLLEPPVPVDDVVAVILGRRYLHERIQ